MILIDDILIYYYIKQDKEAFERKQREREIEIVNKIISEEKQMKKRHQQQPQLWPGNKPRRVPRRRVKSQFAPSSGSESMEYGADVEDIDSKLSYLNKVICLLLIIYFIKLNAYQLYCLNCLDRIVISLRGFASEFLKNNLNIKSVYTEGVRALEVSQMFQLIHYHQFSEFVLLFDIVLILNIISIPGFVLILTVSYYFGHCFIEGFDRRRG